MSTSVVVKHNAEAAHRLPFLPGKCQSLHGHSWWFEVTVAGDPDLNGVLLEFAELKRYVRGWIDANLDHGTMLGAEDPLVAVLRGHNSKVFVFDDSDFDGYCTGGINGGRRLRWPTVENVAELLRRVVTDYLAGNVARPMDVTVQVTETAVNAAVAAGALR